MEKVYTIYFKIGGMSIVLNSDIPFRKNTFLPKFKIFETAAGGKEQIVINHYFKKELNIQLNKDDIVYEHKPWRIFRNKDKDSVIYELTGNNSPDEKQSRKIVTNEKHTIFNIYNNLESKKAFLTQSNYSITLTTTDQIFLAMALSYKSGCIFHSTGIIHRGNGYLFVGHSEEGKSTISRMLMDSSTILCDDRNIIRMTEAGYRLYGTWYHSDLYKLSSESAPLKAIFFLNKHSNNKLTLINNRKKITNHLIGRVIKPFASEGWWQRTFDMIEDISLNVNCLDLEFDKSGKISKAIQEYEA